MNHGANLSHRLLGVLQKFGDSTIKMNLDDYWGGLNSYIHSNESNEHREFSQKESQEFEKLIEQHKTEEEENPNAMKEESDNEYDEYVSDFEDDRRTVPYYKIVEKTRIRRNQEQLIKQ